MTTDGSFSTTVYSWSGVTATTTSEALPILTAGIPYYWEITATGPGGTSAWAGPYSFTTAAVTGTPALSSPTNNAQNQVLTGLTLSWSSSSGGPVTSYAVQMTSDNTFSTTVYSWSGVAATTTSEALPTLAPGMPYYWEITATGPGGSSGGWTSAWTFTTIVGPPGLSSPINGAGNQAVALTLSWTSATAATSYEVQVGTASTFIANSTVFDQSGIGTTSQAVAGLAVSTVYYWRANSTGGGATSAWSGVWTFTTAASPGTPTLSSPVNGVANQAIANLTLSWSSSSGGPVTSYSVQVSTDGTFATGVMSYSPGLTASQALSSLSNETVYYWEVNASGPGGSAWSGIWSFTTGANENYGSWGATTNITLNTASNGANVGSTITNFPVLIRLNSTNFSGWSNTLAGGADIRFSIGNTPTSPLAYQIQRWDGTDNLAEIWILESSVAGGGTTPITMYWNQSGVVSQSSGPAVFNATAGYAAVWHLSDTTDARNLLPLSGAAQPTTKVPGIIDSAYTFNSTSQFFKTPDSTSSNSTALNFSSSTSFTLSGWERDTSAAFGGGDRMIVSKGGSTWNMGERGASTSNYEMMSAENGDWIWDTTKVRPTLGTWHHIVGVRSLTQGTSPIYAESLYVDGALSIPASAINSGAVTAVTTRAIDIGTQPDNPTDFWKGQLQEVEISNVIRTHDWVKLSYQNQQANQTLVTMNAYQPAAPVISAPSNGADKPFDQPDFELGQRYRYERRMA